MAGLVTMPVKVSGIKRLTRMLRELRDEMRQLMTEASARIDTALAGIQGDLDALKAAAVQAGEAAAALQAALDAALAAQDAAVAEAVQAALADAQAANEAALAALADRVEAIDAQTPPPVTP